MGWLDRLFGKIERGEVPAPKDQPQPELTDQFVSAPAELSDAIRAAGGDPAHVVRWIESGAGTIWRFGVPGAKAFSAWKSIHALAPAIRQWPLILGPNESIQFHENFRSEIQAAPCAEILAKADHLNVVDWCEEKRQGRLEFDPEYEPPLGSPDAEGVPQSEFSIPLQTFSRRPHELVWIGLVPVTDSCAVPAAFNFGDWNDVPRPEVHVAFHRYWREQFGAELVGLTNDVMEFTIQRPPRSRAQAFELAEQHYDYCSDIVDQGLGSIDALASTLLKGPIWYFWWD